MQNTDLTNSFICIELQSGDVPLFRTLFDETEVKMHGTKIKLISIEPNKKMGEVTEGTFLKHLIGFNFAFYES